MAEIRVLADAEAATLTYIEGNKQNKRTVAMKTENTNNIDLEAIERKARQLRSEFIAELASSARAWVAAKFTALTLTGSKTA